MKLGSVIVLSVLLAASAVVIADGSDAADQCVVTFSADNGTVTAVADGTSLSSGQKVSSGTEVTFRFSSDRGYAPVSWSVNGSAADYAYQTSVTLTVTSDTSVSVTSEYVSEPTFTNYFRGESILSGTTAWSYGDGKPSGMSWTDMVYDATVVGGTIYAKLDNNLLKIDGSTGKLVKSIETTSAFTGYYEKVVYGHGVLYDCYAGAVYDQDLNQVYKIPTDSTARCAYYSDGCFFVMAYATATSDTTLYCFSAVDEDPSDPDNVQSVKWQSALGIGYEQWSGVFPMIFGDGFFLTAGYDDTGVYMRTADTSTGALISTAYVGETAKMQTGKGYINLDGGLATLAVTGVSAVADVDSSGVLSNLRAASNAGNGKTTSLITAGGYGYVLASGVLYVYDVSDMSLVTSFDGYKAKIGEVHANMVAGTGYEGHVYLYVIPYASSSSVYVLCHDLSSPKSVSVVEMSGLGEKNYSMYQVKFLEDGSFLYHNDNGILYHVVKSGKVSAVILSDYSITVNPGGSRTLTATVIPNDAVDKGVTWASSDPSVASVGPDGTVTAVALGSAVVTVTTNDGGHTAACAVTVAVVKVTGVTLSDDSMSIATGGTRKLAATVLPAEAADKTVTWSSSDESVATVSSDGLVTAVSAGSAVITVTTREGGYTAACAVTVKDVEVASVVVSDRSVSITVGSTKVLGVTISPSDATDRSVTWVSSDPSVATVDSNGKVTAVSAGKTVVTVTSVYGPSDSSEVTVSSAPSPAPEKGSGDNTVIIAVCAVLVAAGIGAAAFVFLRRR